MTQNNNNEQKIINTVRQVVHRYTKEYNVIFPNSQIEWDNVSMYQIYCIFPHLKWKKISTMVLSTYISNIIYNAILYYCKEHSIPETEMYDAMMKNMRKTREDYNAFILNNLNNRHNLSVRRKTHQQAAYYCLQLNIDEISSIYDIIFQTLHCNICNISNAPLIINSMFNWWNDINRDGFDKLCDFDVWLHMDAYINRVITFAITSPITKLVTHRMTKDIMNLRNFNI